MDTMPYTVIERWNEAIAKGDMRTWRACAYLAGLEADRIERTDPDSLIVPALRGIADSAHARYLDMMPKAV